MEKRTLLLVFLLYCSGTSNILGMDSPKKLPSKLHKKAHKGHKGKGEGSGESSGKEMGWRDFLVGSEKIESEKPIKATKKNRASSCSELPELPVPNAVSSSSSSSALTKKEGKLHVESFSKNDLKTQELFGALASLEDPEKVKKLIKKHGLKAKDPKTGNTLLHEFVEQLCELERRFKLTGALLAFFIGDEKRFGHIDFGAKNKKGRTPAGVVKKRLNKDISSLISKIESDQLDRLKGALDATVACSTALKNLTASSSFSATGATGGN